MLIQKGATLVIEPNEIIEKYTKKAILQLSIDELDANVKQKVKDLSQIKEEYREIYKELIEPISINELSIKTKIEISKLYEKLLMMEMEGLITEFQNKYVLKKE